jgi:hypothetical protein
MREHTTTEMRDDATVAREKLVMVRLTVEEHDRWQAAAFANQRKLADYVRVVVNGQLEHVLPSRARQQRKRESAKRYAELVTPKKGR